MPPEQQNEQEIQFKKRARRRLVGAIALVLLMVTILPMLLDDRSAKTSVPEIEISIPSQDNLEESKAFTSKVIAAPLKAAEEQKPDAQQAARVEENPAEQVVAEKTPKVIEDKKPETEAAKPEAEKAISKKEEPKKVETKKEVLKPQADETNTSETTPSSIMVQIGVFSSEENVKQLEQKLKDKGFSTSAQKIQTSKGEKIRLRIGPFADKDKAEQALASIKSAGITGMVVSH